IFHWFIESPTRANNDAGTRCSVYYLGEFYDNVQVDLHGQSSRGFPKKAHDFDFNRENRFKFDEDEERVKDFNFLSNWADKSKVRNSLAYGMYNEGGVKAHWAHPIRVEQNGEFFSTADMVEDGDNRYLDRVGLSRRGALYKMYNRLDSVGGGEKKSRRWEDTKDLQALIDGIRTGSTAEKTSYIYDNVDIPGMINFLVMNKIINNTDFGHKNYYVYRDTEGTGEWVILPWDVDLSLGRRWTSGATYFLDDMQLTTPIDQHAGNSLVNLFFANSSSFRKMFLQHFRTKMDEFYGPPEGMPENPYVMDTINELNQMIDPPGVVSDAALDYEKWGSWGNRNNMAQGLDRIIYEVIPGRREFLYNHNEIPGPQATDPTLDVIEVDYLPESGKQEEEYFVLQNRSGLLDVSGWKISGAIRHTFKQGTVLLSGSIFQPAEGKIYLAKDPAAFRSRRTSPTGGENLFVQGPYEGNLSSRGETIFIHDRAGNLVTEYTYEGESTDLQDNLRITEILFTPLPAEEGSPYKTSDFEYLALQNIGNAELDLTGVYFDDGIDFAFADGTKLAAGETMYVSRFEPAFESRYGAGHRVVGPFFGKLSNGGERIRLRDAIDENILDFSYDDMWSELADSGGHSLMVVDPNAAFETWELPESWTTSPKAGGSLGSGDVVVEPKADYAAWQKDHFTDAQIADALFSGPLADANNDGSSNLMAYAFGFSPMESGSKDMRPQISLVDGYATLTYRQRKTASDLEYAVEESTDLVTWTASDATEESSTENDDGTESRVMRKGSPASANEKSFMRVKISLR
ncbi:MAG: CotH kinase family protein, partial [Verrucomicrobiota bacterium]